jgi:nitrogen fixation protein FixH
MPQELPARAARKAEPREFRLTGVHVFAMFVAFFAVVASVNGYMMQRAISTMPGLDARNGYDASQRYNGLIRRAETQDGRRWTPAATVTAADGKTRITVSFAGGQAVGGQAGGGQAMAAPPMTVSARLEHPATRALDHVLALQPGEGGHGATLPLQLRGLWTLVIEARDADTGEILFQSRNRLTLGG